ncbi:MAG: leucyl/phenylalanyl-tRNA--protein transferase [Bacteroidales bacterium]|nr:leucyl/phenylalanyl-tRNA--protein transferase [Bacteroidales bacterium]
MPVYLLNEEISFPDPNNSNKEGIVAVGGDLSVERLILAYSMGIFPWYSDESPIIWWSPNPRTVLFPYELKLSKNLRSKINKNIFKVKFDTNFAAVIENCANISRNSQNGTWITQEMKEAYINLHQHGYCHSVETYFEDKLVGGLYGVSFGKAFFGESMFYLKTDASKVALYYLVEKLKNWNFDFIDVQQETNHLKSLGAEIIDRKMFLSLLKISNQSPTKKGKWNN